MEYITEVLGVKVIRKEWKDSNKLPYFLTDEYMFELVQLNNCTCVFIKPKKTLAVINTIRKHLIAIQKNCNLPVVFELDRLTRQKRKSFIENKIPFVVADKQLYLPFMGVVLQENFDSEPTSTLNLEKLLPSAQMLLFEFIYGKCKPMYLSETAKRFELAPMSVLRAAKQLAELNLVKMQSEGRLKILCCELTPQKLFEKAKPYLINPVRKTVYINKEQVDNFMFRSGLSALSMLGMLNPPYLEVYGSNAQIKDTAYSDTLIDTEKQCVLEFWKYDTTKLSNDKHTDILSLAVCFDKDADARIQMEIENLLNEKVWN